jgi:hypothetical protein
LAGRRGEVAAGCTQVVGRGRGGVVDIERVGYPVTVAVDSPCRPRGRNELHRADGVVEYPVAIKPAAIGVRDARGPVAGQRNPDDARRRQAVGTHGRASVLSVVGFDPTDPSQQRPADAAAGVATVFARDRALVRIEGDGGDAICHNRADDRNVIGRRQFVVGEAGQCEVSGRRIRVRWRGRCRRRPAGGAFRAELRGPRGFLEERGAGQRARQRGAGRRARGRDRSRRDRTRGRIVVRQPEGAECQHDDHPGGAPRDAPYRRQRWPDVRVCRSAMPSGPRIGW